MNNTLQVYWENEDQLPDLDDNIYDAMFKLSIVDIVRLFPYVEIDGERYYLRSEK